MIKKKISQDLPAKDLNLQKEIEELKAENNTLKEMNILKENEAYYRYLQISLLRDINQNIKDLSLEEEAEEE